MDEYRPMKHQTIIRLALLGPVSTGEWGEQGVGLIDGAYLVKGHPWAEILESYHVGQHKPVC